MYATSELFTIERKYLCLYWLGNIKVCKQGAKQRQPLKNGPCNSFLLDS